MSREQTEIEKDSFTVEESSSFVGAFVGIFYAGNRPNRIVSKRTSKLRLNNWTRKLLAANYEIREQHQAKGKFKKPSETD